MAAGHNIIHRNKAARLKSRLERHITLSSKCAPAMQPICNAALRELTKKLTEVRRELFSVSTHQSDTASASLVLNLNVKTMNGNWQKTGGGNVTSKIKRLNDLKEKAKNSKCRSTVLLHILNAFFFKIQRRFHKR